MVPGISVPPFSHKETDQDPSQESSVSVNTEPVVKTQQQGADSDDGADSLSWATSTTMPWLRTCQKSTHHCALVYVVASYKFLSCFTNNLIKSTSAQCSGNGSECTKISLWAPKKHAPGSPYIGWASSANSVYLSVTSAPQLQKPPYYKKTSSYAPARGSS